MAIVLNELKWAEKAMEDKSLGARPLETLSKIAKYYFYLGKSKPETRALLEKFLLECDPYASVVKWSDRIEGAMKYASKRPLLILSSISVTKPEIDTIRSIKGMQAQRLAFTLLCIAKFNYAAGFNNEYWVTTPDSEIMKMANVNASIKRQSAMFSELRDAGLLYFSKRVDNLSVRVVFVRDGEVALKISDFRNLGYQYMNYIDHGGKYFVCENCGITSKENTSAAGGRKKKYCNECAVKIRMKQNVDSVMRSRTGHTNAAESHKDDREGA